MAIRTRQVKNKRDSNGVLTGRPGTVYDVDIKYTAPDGAKKTYTKRGFATKRDASQHEAEMRTKLQNPGQIASIASQRKQTVANYLNEWVESYARVNLRRNTAISKPTRQRTRLQSLARATKTPDPYTPEQVKALMQRVEGTVWEMPVILGGLYGMRRSEILGLRWRNVDLVVAKADGAPIAASWVSSQFGKLLEDLEMPHIRFHDDRVIIGASQKKPSKIKGLQMILSYHFLQ